MEYTYRTIIEDDFVEINKMLYLAFLNEDKKEYETFLYLKQRIIRAGVDTTVSFGAFLNDQIVGVVLNAVDCAYAFDFVTAVHPAHQHRGIGTKLFQLSADALKEKNILVYRVEIFSDNYDGYKAYTKFGMRKTRELLTYKGNITKYKNTNFKVKKVSLDDFNSPIFKDVDHMPSWENSRRILLKHPELYDIYYTTYPFTNKANSYAIVQRDKGIIRQLHITMDMFKTKNFHKLISQISKDYDEIKVSNIDADWFWSSLMLKKYNFNLVHSTIEMEKVLNSRSIFY